MNNVCYILDGNVNTTRTKLPFTTTTNDSHLFIVGEDQVLRLWSIRSGSLIKSVKFKSRGIQFCNDKLFNLDDTKLVYYSYNHISQVSHIIFFLKKKVRRAT